MFLCNSWTEKRKRKRRLKMLQWDDSGVISSSSLPNLQESHDSNGAIQTVTQSSNDGLITDRDAAISAKSQASGPTPAAEAAAYLMKVHLKQGYGLLAMDNTGSSDPYVKFKHKNSLIYKSQAVTQSLNPRWDEQFEQLINDRSVPLKIDVYDFDRFTTDDFMGRTTIDLSTLPVDSTVNLNLPLTDSETDQEAGSLSLAIFLKPVTSSQAAQIKDRLSSGAVWRGQTATKKRTARSCIIHTVLVEAKDLQPFLLNRSAPKPDPYVKLRFGDERVKSRAASKTLDPKWMQAFTFHQHYQNESMLELQVLDKKRDSLLGKCTIDLSCLEREKTHHKWYNLENNAGKILLVITISGLAEGSVSDLATFESKPIDFTALKREYGLQKTLSLKSVGFLIVKVYRAEGLAALDLGGKSDPFCVVELVNSRMQTNTIYKTLNPEWNKVFTFDVDDINSILELTIFDEDLNKRAEFMGQVGIPLMKIRNGQKRWYALKDESLLKRAKGKILLETTLVWNPVRAAARTFTPKEQKYTAQKGRFQYSVFMRIMSRAEKYGNRLARAGQFIQTCFTWKSPPRSCAAFLAFVLTVYFFELYMVPLALAISLLLSYLTISIAQDDNDTVGDNEYVRSDSEDDDDEEEEDKAAANSSLTARLDAVQAALVDIQAKLEFTVSTLQRVRNTFNFTQPFCTYTAIFVIAVAAIVLYFVPVRWLVMAWGVNKFTKKFRKPRGYVGNNELLDFLSRVPSDKELRMYGDFRLKESSRMAQESAMPDG